MFRKLILSSIGCVSLMFVMGCNSSNNPPASSPSILSEGFEGSLSSWQTEFMINFGDPTYPRMRITTDAAHNGTHSLISDSNRTALLYNLPDKLQDSIACLQFYMMAKEQGHTNFTVQIGQDAGSSGGLCKKFGFGFSPTDSIVTVFFDNYGGVHDTAVKAIVLNQWYKCNIEVNFTTQVISYLLDDQIVRTAPLPTIEMYGIDKLLVLRGFEPTEGEDGVKKCYVDDIVLYKK